MNIEVIFYEEERNGKIVRIPIITRDSTDAQNFWLTEEEKKNIKKRCPKLSGNLHILFQGTDFILEDPNNS